MPGRSDEPLKLGVGGGNISEETVMAVRAVRAQDRAEATMHEFRMRVSVESRVVDTRFRMAASTGHRGTSGL